MVVCHCLLKLYDKQDSWEKVCFTEQYCCRRYDSDNFHFIWQLQNVKLVYLVGCILRQVLDEDFSPVAQLPVSFLQPLLDFLRIQIGQISKTGPLGWRVFILPALWAVRVRERWIFLLYCVYARRLDGGSCRHFEGLGRECGAERR